MPDLNINIVLFGFVFLNITAGNLFLLYLEPSTLEAINFKLRSLGVSICANDTTFWTVGYDIFKNIVDYFFELKYCWVLI